MKFIILGIVLFLNTLIGSVLSIASDKKGFLDDYKNSLDEEEASRKYVEAQANHARKLMLCFFLAFWVLVNLAGYQILFH